MNIAAVKNGIVINSYVFDDMQTAEQFLADGVLGDVDMVAELPEEYRSGDYYTDGHWTKKEAPEPEPTEGTPIDDITALQIAVTEIYEMMLGGITNG